MNNDLDRLMRYLDGELAEAEAAEVEARLKTDESYQAERLALKRVDHLLRSAPLAAPPPDFMARFESRLERRLNRRRNIIGASMIGLILVLAAGLLWWPLAGANLSLSGWLNSAQVLEAVVTLVQNLLWGLSLAFRVGAVMVETAFQLVKHPVFWGYALLVLGLVSLWAQLLKWAGFARPPANI